ncbi:unnamed protein product [Amoebophrya sp. A25]|nr:unnamed protein product [Amoebophrya sp. A25]|eukprot:GSA25T00019123001.1
MAARPPPLGTEDEDEQRPASTSREGGFSPRWLVRMRQRVRDKTSVSTAASGSSRGQSSSAGPIAQKYRMLIPSVTFVELLSAATVVALYGKGLVYFFHETDGVAEPAQWHTFLHSSLALLLYICAWRYWKQMRNYKEFLLARSSGMSSGASQFGVTEHAEMSSSSKPNPPLSKVLTFPANFYSGTGKALPVASKSDSKASTTAGGSSCASSPLSDKLSSPATPDIKNKNLLAGPSSPPSVRGPSPVSKDYDTQTSDEDEEARRMIALGYEERINPQQEGVRIGWGNALIVVFTYWHRAYFMHCTVERICTHHPLRGELFSVHSLVSPLAGRLIAMVGETVFMWNGVIPCVSWKNYAREKKLILCALVGFAEMVSNTGVIKRHYGFFLVENSTWTIVFSVIFWQIFKKRFFLCKIGRDQEQSKSGKKKPVLRMLVLTRFIALLTIGLYIGYQLYFDLPMYYSLWCARENEPGYDLALYPEGLWHSLQCQTLVDNNSSALRPVMLWQAANYTLVPLVIVLLCWLTQEGSYVLLALDRRVFWNVNEDPGQISLWIKRPTIKASFYDGASLTALLRGKLDAKDAFPDEYK